MKEERDLLRKEILHKLLMWIFIVLTSLTAYMSYILGQQVHVKFYYGLLLIVPFGLGVLFFRSVMLRYRALYHININWGKAEERKRKFEDIKKLHMFLKNEEKEKFYIDNQTWEDLNMNKVFERLDRTLSTPGEQVLYNMLHTPLFDEDAVNKRKNIITFFQQARELREKIQTELYWLDRQNKNTITDLLWGELPNKSKLSILFNLMALLPLVIILLIPFLGVQISVYIVFVFMANMYIHMKFKNKISIHVDSISYLSAVVNTGKKLSEFDEEVLHSILQELKENTRKLKVSKNAGVIGSVEGIDMLMDYINILFLTKERKFYKVLDELKSHKNEIRRVYLAIGEIDALISIASYRKGLKSYSEPTLTKDCMVLEVKSLVHPLIDNPVPNSISIINGGIILTGSNMSGKSTFLRTVGVNALFTQTIGTCLAESYCGSYFKILTSISPNDDILMGKSYYLGEAEAVLRIIKSCVSEIPSLCIIDEIFRGTNPVERIGASAEILDYLIENNALPIVATHDLELAELVDKAYECYYFTEDVSEDGLEFDYRIRKGISPTRNAIKLLKFLGYPEDIISRTYKRIDILFGK